MMQLTAVTLVERPDLRPEMQRIERQGWSEHMRHDAVAARYWGRLFTDFAGFQLLLLDPDGAVAGTGYTIPLAWDGTVEGLPAGWDAALEAGGRGADSGLPANTLCALAALVERSRLGQGLSASVIGAMKECAARHGLNALIAPVRPTHKSRYPLQPMERYVRWTRADGLPFDPWIRTHHRLGAKTLAVAPESMTITGTVSEWEAWTGMAFPESGSYVIADALVPIEIDREGDQGIYVEPNVWMLHQV
jgi:GNAT superfamily N-acetyltransferase